MASSFLRVSIKLLNFFEVEALSDVEDLIAVIRIANT